MATDSKLAARACAPCPLVARTPAFPAIFVRVCPPGQRCRSSVVEHFIGNEEVVSSILTGSTIMLTNRKLVWSVLECISVQLGALARASVIPVGCALRRSPFPETRERIPPRSSEPPGRRASVRWCLLAKKIGLSFQQLQSTKLTSSLSAWPRPLYGGFNESGP